MPFITDNSQLNFPKTDRAPLGAGRDPTQHVTGAEWNKTCQAIIDSRAWFLSGTYYGILSQSTMPNVQMGLSGTVGAWWLSSSLHPYFTTTSSAGLATRKIALAPTGTNVWTGWWDMVLVDEQGIVVSGSATGGGGGGSSSTSSLDFLTRDLTVQRNSYFSGTIDASALQMSGTVFGIPLIVLRKTTPSNPGRYISFVSASTEWASLNMTNTTSSLEQIQLNMGSSKYFEILSAGTRLFNVGPTGITIGTAIGINAGNGNWTQVGNIDSCNNLTASIGIKSNLDLEATRNLLILGNASFVSLTGSGGGKFLDLEVTRNFTLTNVTGTSVKATLDLEATRNLLIGGNASFVSLTGSGGAKFLDLEVTRNFTLTNVTASSIRATLDMSVARSFQASSLTSSNTPSGYVFFAGTNGELQYSAVANGQLSWDNSNKRLGIGSATPAQTLHLGNTAAASNYIRIDSSPGTGYFGVDSNGFCVIQAGTAAKGVSFYNSAGGNPIVNVDSVGTITGSAMVITGTVGDDIERITVKNGAATNFAIKASGRLCNFNADNLETSVGVAGGASALPATPLGYLIFEISAGGNTAQIPYYNVP